MVTHEQLSLSTVEIFTRHIKAFVIPAFSRDDLNPGSMKDGPLVAIIPCAVPQATRKSHE